MITQALSNDELRRYSRHLIMPEFGMDAQRKLKQGSVLLIGAGGLGSPLALYLAAAGVGRIGIIDFDQVDESNLQRQILHGNTSVGIPKAESARRRLSDLNPYIDITTYELALDSSNALGLFRPYDVIIDGTDNFPTRYLTNDASVLLGKPNVYGSIFRFEGQASVFAPQAGGPCYRCLFPEPPPPDLVPNCAEAGVLGVLPGVIGTIQATEAIKLLTGIGTPLIGRLILYDALEMSFRELKLRRNPNCPVCGDHPTVTALIDYQHFCGVKTPAMPPIEEITPAELATWLQQPDRPFLLDVREANEWEIGYLHGAVRISVNELAARITELHDQRDNPVVIYCRSGARSARAVTMLQQAGFRRVINMAGGTLRWSDEVDPSLPKY
jgi:adenylyltransferase/sulfurtransferase